MTKSKPVLLHLDPSKVKPGEKLEDFFFRIQVEYLRSQLDPGVFTRKEKSQVKPKRVK